MQFGTGIETSHLDAWPESGPPVASVHPEQLRVGMWPSMNCRLSLW